MVTEIEISKRGCGERVEGGLYFFSDEPVNLHSWFPRPLTCKCGHKVIKTSRNIQRFNPAQVFPELHVTSEAETPMKMYNEDSAWAITVGVQHYRIPEDFLSEAATEGISRRIMAVPRGFILGESWVFLLHPHVYRTQVVNDNPKAGDQLKLMPDECWSGGVIGAFKPTQIQYVVTGNESEAYLQSLIVKGITPIKVTYRNG